MAKDTNQRSHDVIWPAHGSPSWPMGQKKCWFSNQLGENRALEGKIGLFWHELNHWPARWPMSSSDDIVWSLICVLCHQNLIMPENAIFPPRALFSPNWLNQHFIWPIGQLGDPWAGQMTSCDLWFVSFAIRSNYDRKGPFSPLVLYFDQIDP